MGANSTQAYGITLFLTAFVLISAGFAGGGILLVVLGLAVLAASVFLFLKAKPLEHREG